MLRRLPLGRVLRNTTLVRRLGGPLPGFAHRVSHRRFQQRIKSDMMKEILLPLTEDLLERGDLVT